MEIKYLSLHCHHQNDSCIKTGSDESHCNVSVGSDGQSYKTVGSDESHCNVSVGSDGQSHKTESTNHNLSEEKGEPKRYRTEVLPLTSHNALPLGHTGSPPSSFCRL